MKSWKNWAFFGLVAIVLFGFVGCEDKDDGDDSKYQVNTTLFGAGAKVTADSMTQEQFNLACTKLKNAYDSIILDGGQPASRCAIFASDSLKVNFANTNSYNYYSVNLGALTINYNANFVLTSSATELKAKVISSADAVALGTNLQQ